MYRLFQIAKIAYQSVLVTKLLQPDNEEYLAFEQEYMMRAQRDYNYTYGGRYVGVRGSLCRCTVVVM
jgi:hypothetical protein